MNLNAALVEQEQPELLDEVEGNRLIANELLDESRRSELGQFMTPAPVARLMASMYQDFTGNINLLDAGAGVGSLTAAFVEEACNRSKQPKRIISHGYELEPVLASYLRKTHQLCKQVSNQHHIDYASSIIEDDFITQATTLLKKQSELQPRYNRAILNPPYCKINSDSDTRKKLRAVGIETTNLYSAFVALAIRLLEDGGELVAITPRSFCNGPYFKPFREILLKEMTLKRIHIFHSRNRAFKGDKVLQENIIFHAIKTINKNTPVTISTSTCAEDKNIISRQVKQNEVVQPNDPDLFIHIAATKEDSQITEAALSLPCTLKDLDIQVSTGRVVDFRAKKYLRDEPDKSTIPLIYPTHYDNGFISWPKINCKKPNALQDCEATKNLMVPTGIYTLVKRFSSKEERRRIVAAVYDARAIKATHVGIENHLNYFHCNGEGLAPNLAKGLSLFLNATLVDKYFRLFNGHTQVNATDLRSLRYPTTEQLNALGKRYRTQLPDQDVIDTIIQETLFS